MCSGLWNVPFISSCYLIKRAVFPKITYADDDLDPDMAMCKNLRAQVQCEIFFLLYFNPFCSYCYTKKKGLDYCTKFFSIYTYNSIKCLKNMAKTG